VFHENGLIRVRVVTSESSVAVDGWIADGSALKCQRAAGGPAAGPAALRRRGVTFVFSVRAKGLMKNRLRAPDFDIRTE